MGPLLFFFVSGASGLIYEIVWVRQFGLLFGSTVYSAALVTGIFMCGLGLGSWLGRLARVPTADSYDREHDESGDAAKLVKAFHGGFAAYAYSIRLSGPKS